MRAMLTLLPLLLGCNDLKGLVAKAISDAGVGVDIEGAVQVKGDPPSALRFTLFAPSLNPDGFDPDVCPKLETSVAGETVLSPEPDCYGRINMLELTTPSAAEDGGELVVKLKGDDFVIEDVPFDFGYVLEVTGDDPTVMCTTDYVGYDPDTKLTTTDSLVSLDLDELELELDVPAYTLSRKARIFCVSEESAGDLDLSDIATREDKDHPDAPLDDEGSLKDPPADGAPQESWPLVRVGLLDRHYMPEDILRYAEKDGTVADLGGYLDELADITEGGQTMPLDCKGLPGASATGGDYPDRVIIAADVETDADTAFVRVQYGSGDEGDIRTFETPVVNGTIVQAVPMTGGFAKLQLDTNADLDGVGESPVATFCEENDPASRQMLVTTTWNSTSDVDLEVLADGMPASWYCAPEGHGLMVLTSEKGYGVEAYSSGDTTWEGGSDLVYDVKVHHYTLGAEPTEVTVRVVYTDPQTLEVCDFSAKRTLAADEWWVVGSFGPGLACPKDLM